MLRKKKRGETGKGTEKEKEERLEKVLRKKNKKRQSSRNEECVVLCVFYPPVCTARAIHRCLDEPPGIEKVKCIKPSVRNDAELLSICELS